MAVASPCRYDHPGSMEAVVDIPTERIRRISRKEYDQMVAVGLFQGARIELLNGRLMTASPQYAAHASTVQRLSKWLVTELGDRADVRVQLPFAASDDSEPEPDISVVPVGDYDAEHPRSAYLIIEVADSFLNDDRFIKRPVYATAGVPEYWILNIVDRCIEVFKPTSSEPARIVTSTDEITVPGFDDVRIRVESLLPRRRES